jgi:hypothetical protein
MDTSRRLSDVSIEFAHTEFIIQEPNISKFDEDVVYRSSVIARQLNDKLTAQGLTCATCILIDDKQVGKPLTPQEVHPLLHIARQQLEVNYICFENRLPMYRDLVLALLPEKQRRRVARDMQHYIDKHGKIACSHDIAIWHLMRLGYLDHLGPDLIIPFDNYGRLRIPHFEAKRVVSILSRKLGHDVQEEKADRDILRYCDIPDLSERVQRIYIEDLQDRSEPPWISTITAFH